MTKHPVSQCLRRLPPPSLATSRSQKLLKSWGSQYVVERRKIRSAWKEAIKNIVNGILRVYIYSLFGELFCGWQREFKGRAAEKNRKGFIAENWARAFEVFGTSIDDEGKIRPSEPSGVFRAPTLRTSCYSGRVHGWRLEVWLSVVLPSGLICFQTSQVFVTRKFKVINNRKLF